MQCPKSGSGKANNGSVVLELALPAPHGSTAMNSAVWADTIGHGPAWGIGELDHDRQNVSPRVTPNHAHSAT